MNELNNYENFYVKESLEGLVNVIITDKKEKLVNMGELHEVLKVKTRFNDWIIRRIENGGFEEKIDFYTTLSKSSGGRPKTEYYFMIDAAKEVALMENNEMGKYFRLYFIEMEKKAIRFLGKETRRNLTDVITEYLKPNDPALYGIITNEFIYKVLFNKSKKQLCEWLNISGNIRDEMDKESLEKIDAHESKLIEFIVDYGMKYEDLKKLMDKKRINNFYKKKGF